MLRQLALAALLLLAAPQTLWAAEAGFRLVVHDTNPTQSLSAAVASKLFLKKERVWQHDLVVVPLDQKPDSSTRQAFSREIHHKSVSAIKSYWKRAIYSGRGVPPPELGSDRDVLEGLLKEPGAIGYVAIDTPLPSGVKGIDIVDSSGTVLFAGSGAPQEAWEDDPWKPVTLSRHGDIHLFVVGSCGLGDQGRQAVVENRRPDVAVQIRIERALWVDGSFHRNQHETLTLQPLEEKELGCTRPSAHSETRFSLAEVSDASTYPQTIATYGISPMSPARDQIQLVVGSSCGQGRAGHMIVLVNKDLVRTISVQISHHQQMGEGQSRRYKKSYHLPPGGRKKLGCSQDGGVARKVSVVRASYR